MYVKSILLFALIILYAFFIGEYIHSMKIFKEKKRYSSCILTGIIVIFALYQIIAIPFMIIKTTFILMHTVEVLVLATIFIVLLVRAYKNKLWKSLFKFKKISNINIVYILVIFLVILQSVCVSYLTHTDDDDGYFITISNIALEENKIELDDILVYNGHSDSESFRPQLSSWELMVASISKIINMPPAILAHTVMPIVLIPLCYLAVYSLFSCFFTKDKDVWNAILIYCVLNIISGYATHSTGSFLLLRIWQGKAMLANFAIPVVIMDCTKIIRNEENIYTWIELMLLTIVGVFMSVVGIYLIPLLYVCSGVPYLLYLLFANIKRFTKLILFAVLSMVPALIIAVYSFIQIVQTEYGVYFINESLPADWLNIFKSTIGDGVVFGLYVLCTIFVIFKGKLYEKLILVGMPVVVVLTLLNPLFIDFVSTKITGVNVYWRLYWLIPFFIVISIGIVMIINCIGIRHKCLVTIIFSIKIYILGDNIFSNQYLFAAHVNSYKLPDIALNSVNYILDDSKYKNKIMVMYPDDLSAKVRQVSSKIIVPIACGMSFRNDMYVNDTSFAEIYNSVYVKKVIEAKTNKALMDLSVEYIVCNNQILFIDESGYELINKMDGYFIYKNSI